jgi:hypothetical protein
MQLITHNKYIMKGKQPKIRSKKNQNLQTQKMQPHVICLPYFLK